MPSTALRSLKSARATGLGGTEMRQKRTLARRPDARHIVERRRADGLGPFRAMRADGEAMRLVAHSLDEI